MAKDKKKKQSKKEKDNSAESSAKPMQMSKEMMESFQKTYQEALEAVAKSKKGMQESDEVKKAREEGKKAGIIVAELEECNKIIEKLKTKLPVVSMTYVRDVMTEYKVDGISQKDMDLLKKNNMSFPRITKVKHTYPINFKSFGNDTYIKKGGRKISLQKNGKDDPTLIVQDGDIIGTGRNSYTFGISDSSTCKPEGWENREYSTDIMLFPESELKLSIKTKIKEPEFSEGMNVHPSITITDTISDVELLKGIFKIDISREKRDINNMLHLPSRYPEIEFKSGMSAAAGIYDDVIDKLKAGNIKGGAQAAVMAKLMEQYTKAKQNMKASTAITDRIYTFIELNDDGSLVIFGGNQVKHMGTGKESGKTMKNLMKTGNRTAVGKPIKITVTSSRLYETDCGQNLDRRVEMIIKKEVALTNYLNVLNFKAEQKEREEKEMKEQKPKLSPKEQAAEGKRVMIEGAKQGLATAKEIGDKELIEMEEQVLKGAESMNNEKEFEEMDALVGESMRKAREQIDKMERESKPLLDAPLPSYNSPSEADAV